ncbi:MAG: hypothetical protein QM773_05945 [Hyphomonadaceae bacterium]
MFEVWVDAAFVRVVLADDDVAAGLVRIVDEAVAGLLARGKDGVITGLEGQAFIAEAERAFAFEHVEVLFLQHVEVEGA